MEFCDLGEHCYFCNMQDFLPMVCEYCKYDFCKEHINTELHECQSIPKKKVIKKKKEAKIFCCSKKCKESVILITCSACKQLVCTSHRYQDKHPCESKITDLSMSAKAISCF